MSLNQQERLAAEKVARQSSAIAGALSGLVDRVKDSSALAQIETLVPWLGHTMDVAAEALPPIKAVAKLLEKATAIDDPLDLGMIACTAAYHQSCLEAFSIAGKPAASIAFYSDDAVSKTKSEIGKSLAAIEARDPRLLENFSLQSATTHQFTRAADAALLAVAAHFGYTPPERNRLLSVVHHRFVTHLKILLVSGSKDKDRYRNFRELIQLNTDESNIRALVHENADRQVYSFYQAPVLQVEPFTLADVYLEPECGILPASRTKQHLAAFDESPEAGGRISLLNAVLEKLGDPNFKDVIVIQGLPGAGKSTFTLRLCAELAKQGLCPVRVRMRDLPLEKSLLEAIGDALSVVEGVRLECADYTNGSHLTRLFNESFEFGKTSICPYVFILDAWDEISRFTREGEGFQLRVERMMAEVRSIFLRQTAPPVRVILTGRPSDVIANSPLLHDDTPVHTIRPLRKEQLPQYVELLDRAIRRQRFSSERILPLDLGDRTLYEPVWERYLQPKPNSQERELEVLGLPLLLHLAIRVLSKEPGMIQSIGGNPTNLYRHLIDQTSASAAKPSHAPDAPKESMLPVDTGFRQDLQQVAVAITTLGGEWISFDELGKRCGKEFLRKFREPKGQNPFSRLVIGFFFKAGTADGIEFLHKSFREYLFAEAVIQILLDYGEKAPANLPEREPYWKEFAEDDVRHRILRNRLAPVVAAQTFSAEIESHLDSLIGWQLRDDLPRWRIIRDGLADMWDWWGEGVHLRGQPYRDKNDNTEYHPPYVVELVEKSLPQRRYDLDADPVPYRTTDADSNLGLALYSLAVSTHWWTARQQGLHRIPKVLKHVRRYQFVVEYAGGETSTRFGPSGPQPDYFLNYARRIQAAGSQRSKNFLADRIHVGIVLANCNLTGLDFSGASLVYAELRGAILRPAALSRTALYDSNLSGADLTGADLNSATLHGADLTYATCTQQQLESAIGNRDTRIPDGMVRPSRWFS